MRLFLGLNLQSRGQSLARATNLARVSPILGAEGHSSRPRGGPSRQSSLYRENEVMHRSGVAKQAATTRVPKIEVPMRLELLDRIVLPPYSRIPLKMPSEA